MIRTDDGETELATGPFGGRSPAEYTELINTLVEFRNAYIPYINATAQAVYDGNTPVHDAERARIRHLAVTAEDAFSAAGIQFAWVAPPVYSAAPPLIGLSQVAFAHEDHRYRGRDDTLFHGSSPRSPEKTIDAVDTAVTTLRKLSDQEAHRRRRPTYWPDRILRAILGFPGYLISLVFGFDRREVSSGAAQALWIVSLIADGITIFVAGNALGWW